ncbi:MAG: S-adenosylmethionine-dependent methyltransferase [Thelocarpon superellum]|nr:MAG: S-adenosylmethionine-dependent methyltransferase [Thelocarpon superellum]
MLPTPSTSHVSFSNIYEPAEDSFLLLDTLSSKSEVEFLQSRLDGAAPMPHGCPLAVEIGTGSGVILAFLTTNALAIFGRADVMTVGTDVNLFACQASRRTVLEAVSTSNAAAGRDASMASPLFLDTVMADLGSVLRCGAVDVLVFNPPYVPTDDVPALQPDTWNGYGLGKVHSSCEQDSHLLSLSYAGGVDGMATTQRLIDNVPALLSARGVAYILLCAQNHPDAVISQIRAWGNGWKVETAGRSGKQAGWERLQVLRIWRIH